MTEATLQRLESKSTKIGPGERLTYWLGKLAVDCGDGITAKTPEQAAARRARKVAWAAHESGRVTLTQERLPTGGFAYLATGTGR
jgi:hypothetical protein